MKKLDTFIPYAKPSIIQEDLALMNEAMLGSSITRGPYVEKFESAISKYCGSTYAVCFNSGTTALQAAYFAVNGSKSDRLVTTPNTFAATIVPGILYGSEIELVDIDRTSGNLSLDKIKASSKRSIYMPVHFSGNPVDIEALRSSTAGVIIEDAAHALGSLDKEGSPIGSCKHSDMTILSFHPAKSITTGEGGMVTTNSPELNEKLRFYRNNGMVRDPQKAQYPGYYEIHEATGNFNVTDFQAALGLSQLKRLPLFVEKRRKLVKEYRNQLNGIKQIRLFSEEHDANSAHHLLVAQIEFEHLGKNRSQVMEQLKELNIGTQVHYIPLHHHPILNRQYHLPEMEAYYKNALTLPLYYDLEIEEVKLICSNLKALLGL